MEIKIDIEDKSKLVEKELEQKMPELLSAIGNELYKSIYNFMTEDNVVDTGRLRGSISFSTPFENYKNPTLANKGDDFIVNAKIKDTVVVGSNVEYASFVETGTSRQRARKFLQTGTYRSLPQVKAVVEKILKGD